MFNRQILDALPVAIWVAEAPSGKAVYANPQFRRIVGVDAVEASRIEDASETYRVFDAEGRSYPVDRLPFSRVVATGGPVTADDLVIHRPDGQHVNLRVFANPINTGGSVTHVVVTFVDIAEEVRAEAGRRRTESLLSFAVDHAPIAIWSADAEGRITLSEGAGLASLGVKSGQLVGQNIFELYQGNPSIVDAIRRGLAGESFWYVAEANGAVYDTWLRPMVDAAGQVVGVTGLSNDVTAIRHLQATTIQNDRVIAMGTLAASVAHEINNPLTFMLGHVDVLAKALDRLGLAVRGLPESLQLDLSLLVTTAREALDPVRSGTARIAGITRELRTFGRPATEISHVEVQAAVRSVFELVGKEVESRAVVMMDLLPTARIRGNSPQLVQVILNLVMNAMHALPASEPAVNRIWVRVAEDGDRVVIEVADNGPGVPPDMRERIFEPFQTTKEVGEGSGLGLFVCRNIVRGWSGDVSVDDRPGGGARFRVELPAVREVVAPAAVVPAASTHRSAQILIVDDEPLVAKMLGLLLEKAGHRVTIETDSPRAIDMLTAGDPQYELVYCDLMMKGTSGMDLAAALARLAPSTLDRVVFMTGGAFTGAARDFRAVHDQQCVDKPFDIVAETARRLASWS